MMHIIHYILPVVFIAFGAFGSDTCKVQIDLLHLKGDRVRVTVFPPAPQEGELRYLLPTIIPGTYYQVNYGRFYSHFRAYSKAGDRLRVKRDGKNAIVIPEGEKLHRLEYFVRDSYDDIKIWDNMVGSGGTDFENSRVFVINHQLFYGYFDGAMNNPFRLIVLHPDSLYGSGGLPMQHGADADTANAPDYFTLADNPLLYCKADTTSINMGGCRFGFSVYSPNGYINAEHVKNALLPTIDALHVFFGEFPVKNYCFLFYFNDRNGIMRNLSYGALEHLNSSFYFLTELSPDAALDKYFQFIAAHEFMHLLTPLNLHSTEIEHFDFHTPRMSSQLWMYEGMTDYFALKAIAHDSLWSREDFIFDLLRAARADQGMPLYSMTESSKNIIVRHFWELLPKIKQLANFYERGKLIAFYMDICMLRQSAYTESLRELMLGLLTKYHKGVPFKDEEILYEIGKLAPAGTADILKRFVIGSERLPYADIFAAVGYNWVEKGCMAYSFGKVRMYYNAKAGKYKITANTNNCLNLQKGDLILKIDGQDFNPSTFRNLYISRIMIPENRQLTVDILRNGKAVALTGTPCKDRKLKRSWVLSDDQAAKSAAKLLNRCIFGF